MADIHIHRAHRLGLPRARDVARQWADEAQQKFGMQCKVVEGASVATVEFTRPGASGTLTVAADRFELQATLGFLLGTFRGSIEAEIERALDALLAKNAKPARATTAAGAKKAAAKRPAATVVAAKKTPRK